MKLRYKTNELIFIFSFKRPTGVGQWIFVSNSAFSFGELCIIISKYYRLSRGVLTKSLKISITEVSYELFDLILNYYIKEDTYKVFF